MDSKALLIAAAREIGLNTKHTGGGCMALSLDISSDYPSISGAEILITDDGGAGIPVSLWDEHCIMGIYDYDGACILTKPGKAIDLLSMVSGFNYE
tara:strand:+ start:686 stop:973 length:288 start_codon:yes stop_codon:yes gene_type:complete